MTSFPPTPLRYQNQLLLDNTRSRVAYIGYEGTIFHISGPLAPVAGAQSGVNLINIAHLDPPFRQLDNKGARQDGVTYYDTLFEPAEIDMQVELCGLDASDTRRVISAWFGAWSPKNTGKLSWTSPERGEWWANVRMNRQVQNQFKQDWYTSRGVTFNWTCRNDDAFWRSVDSVSNFQGEDEVQTVSITGGPNGGFFQLTFRGDTTGPIGYNSTAADVKAALESLGTVGANNVQVGGVQGGPFTITFTGAFSQVAVDLLAATSSFFGGSGPFAHIFRETVGGSHGGHLTLTNTGDQPGWPRYLCYGPGTFSIGEPGSGNVVKFGPLKPGQIALLSTLPRLPTVVDLSPGQAASGNIVQTLITDLVNFATNNNVPPLLQEFESVFGILPPQGSLYSLLDGRFTTPIPPMLEQVGPMPVSIPCSIQGGTSSSNVIASVTPFRRWPE